MTNNTESALTAPLLDVLNGDGVEAHSASGFERRDAAIGDHQQDSKYDKRAKQQCRKKYWRVCFVLTFAMGCVILYYLQFPPIMFWIYHHTAVRNWIGTSDQLWSEPFFKWWELHHALRLVQGLPAELPTGEYHFDIIRNESDLARIRQRPAWILRTIGGIPYFAWSAEGTTWPTGIKALDPVFREEEVLQAFENCATMAAAAKVETKFGWIGPTKGFTDRKALDEFMMDGLYEFRDGERKALGGYEEQIKELEKCSVITKNI